MSGEEEQTGLGSMGRNNWTISAMHPKDCSGVVKPSLHILGSGRYTLSL